MRHYHVFSLRGQHQPAEERRGRSRPEDLSRDEAGHVRRPDARESVRQRAREVRELARRASTLWRTVELRDSERGILRIRCAFFRVRVIVEGRTSRAAEWLVIRQLHEPRQYSYTLLNAPAETPPERVAELSARRYFVERTFQDAKS